MIQGPILAAALAGAAEKTKGLGDPACLKAKMRARRRVSRASVR